jgi:pyrimidine operon attenuation protein/uracil phosphoribosyltransferase
LAVLVDRGGRELPIEAQFVGARVQMGTDESLSLARDAAGHLSFVVERAT